MPMSYTPSPASPGHDQAAYFAALLCDAAREAAALEAQLRLCAAEIKLYERQIFKAAAAEMALRRRFTGTAHGFAALAMAGLAGPLARRLAPPAPVLIPAATRHDDFTLIRGIDDETALVLAGFGLSQFSDLAAFKPDDVAVLGAALSDPRRISRDGWIEQAALLARGQMTSFARAQIAARTTPPDNVVAFPSLVTRAAPGAPVDTANDTAETSVARAETVTNLVAFEQPRRARRRNWPIVAASLAMLAIVSIATLGIRPAVAQYLGGFGCAQSSLFPVGCVETSWLAR